jgi:agmatinase
VDIDGFDPAYAPATGTPEPGGLDWFEVSALVRELARSRRIVAMDVTEVRPEPGDVRTEFLAARLVQRVMAWVLRAEAAR